MYRICVLAAALAAKRMTAARAPGKDAAAFAPSTHDQAMSGLLMIASKDKARPPTAAPVRGYRARAPKMLASKHDSDRITPIHF